ncbi:MAG: helix-turn-helix transcriptional regulator [Cellulophaga sp.]
MFIIKQLRRKKKLNQTDLAKSIGVSLRTIQLYERKEANIPIKNLKKIAEYFEVSIGQLYAQEVNEVNFEYKRDTKASKKGHTIRKLAPGKYLLSVPLITMGEQLPYIQAYDNMEYINILAQISFVIDQVTVVNYRAFEISDNSMTNGKLDGLPQKTIVLSKQVRINELSNKSNRNHFWIIVYQDTIMCKEITSYDKKKGVVLCHSLNSSPEYPDFEIEIKGIKQLFKIIKKQVD